MKIQETEGMSEWQSELIFFYKFEITNHLSFRLKKLIYIFYVKILINNILKT